MSMVTVTATREFATYVHGDCVSVAKGQTFVVPKDKADELAAAGFVTMGAKAPETKDATRLSRVVSDVVPDPDDITDDEAQNVADVEKGRAAVDPSIARAREQAGKEQGGTTDPADEGEAAKGSFTTGKRDVSKGPRPASKPKRTGQATAKRKPRGTGKGPVAKDTPESQDPDGVGVKEDVSTVGKSGPTVKHDGPKDDPAAGTEGQTGPAVADPSPGTVKKPS